MGGFHFQPGSHSRCICPTCCQPAGVYGVQCRLSLLCAQPRRLPAGGLGPGAPPRPRIYLMQVCLWLVACWSASQTVRASLACPSGEGGHRCGSAWAAANADDDASAPTMSLPCARPITHLLVCCFWLTPPNMFRPLYSPTLLNRGYSYCEGHLHLSAHLSRLDAAVSLLAGRHRQPLHG